MVRAHCAALDPRAQGLALGGEYGGAAVYVGEHVPDNKRGYYTSFIQITATLGLFVSLIVILVTQNSMTKEQFSAYGWRIPFLISIILVIISLYIRLKMKESPIFAELKATGMTSTQPLKGRLHQVAQPEAGADFALRRHRRPGRGLVYRTVLRVVLHADHSESKRQDGEHHGRGRPALRHAVLHRGRSAL